MRPKKSSTHDPEVVAIYFPSWHPDSHYAKWYGKGFSEWELLKTTQSLFTGHGQPKMPLWGYFDESKPEWMEKQIDLAVNHGLTGFIFDWYWYGGEKFLHKALEDGFLKSRNKGRLKFSLMWANHDWGVWPAKSDVPGMANMVNQGDTLLLKMTHSPEDLGRAIAYCCLHYFKHDHYWRIGGEPVFSFFDLDCLTRQLGGAEKAARAIELMRKTVRRHGFDGLYLLGNIGCCNDNAYCCGWGRVGSAKSLGFNSVFAYNIVRSPSYKTLPDEMPVYDYSEVMASHALCWDRIEAGGLTHFPSVTTGLDVSPRWDRQTKFPMDFKKLGYEPIVINNTPEKFGQLLSRALGRVKPGRFGERAVIINAWNEWTEGMYLLPEERHGTAYLEALRQAVTSTSGT
ncbi:MAG: glycoside hydrolase family 99-like domain-containing protein [Kiritimatiellae bacterium]|nr:glycoside hydrolase family 99-like domain-containing protein [Verrucomicrobiota bacterium]MCG2658728.1 glycoside hydrolase family 99-like domain-containing protein [Kiritimatiellia bacterium]